MIKERFLRSHMKEYQENLRYFFLHMVVTLVNGLFLPELTLPITVTEAALAFDTLFEMHYILFFFADCQSIQ